MFLVVKYFTCQNLASDPDVGANLESDCDGDSLGVKNELLGEKGDTEEESRAVLTIGSFSAYVHARSLVPGKN